MLLNVVQATAGQIETIENKYFTNLKKLLQTVECTYDNEDDIYFITINSFINTSIMSFQVRNSGTKPMFFSLTKRQVRYDVAYPEGKLLENLKDISEKAIKAWAAGAAL